MSADNYYVIRKDVHGFFVPVMGFASADKNYIPRVESRDPRFNTVSQAIDFAIDSYSEYGVSVHPECSSKKVPVLEKTDDDHYYDCDFSDEFFSSYHTSSPLCSCEEIEKDWKMKVYPVSAE